ncbi:hypothetical protein pb186bvf_006941 [Paramecium bursaria]
MSAEQLNENELLGSILQNDSSDDEPMNYANSLLVQTQDSIIENSFERNYFDSFNKSFERMSIGSAGSPISPYQQISNSFDAHSYSTRDNSIIYKGEDHGQKRPGYMSPGHSRIPHKSNYNQNWQPIVDVNDDIKLTQDIDNMCGNQMLSRKVQKIFEQGRPDQKELIFNKIERSCFQFSKDVFGNYLVQRVFEKGSHNQQQRLFNKLKPHFYDLAKNNFGCRVIQKIIECIQYDESLQNQLLQYIQPQTKSLIYDQYGNYVLLKALETLQPQKLAFILKPIEETLHYMCSQTYGCKIIFKILEVFPLEYTETILQKAVANNKLYSQEFGNYILQFALSQMKHIDLISNFIYHNIEALCMNKYASNTVEKFVDIANAQQFEILTALFIQPPQQPLFLNLATNPFGNYVAKKYLLICDPLIVAPLLKMLDHRCLAYIKKSEYGQRVYALLEKLTTTA